MRIISLNLPEELCEEKGLQPVKMSRLGKVVLIAGKNGAGKTRLLDLIKKYLSLYPTIENSASHTVTIMSEQNKISKWNSQINSDESNNEELRKKIQIAGNIIERAKKLLNYNIHCKLSGEMQANAVINFIPKSTQLLDSYSLNPNDIITHSQNVIKSGTDNIGNAILPYIQKIANGYIATQISQKATSLSDEEKKSAIADFERLNAVIRKFLKTEIRINDELQATLFDKRIGIAALSDGQKILLQICIAIFVQGSQISNCLLIIDEPENHLHPAALLEAIDTIIDNIENGQVWIATHSVNVLAHFDASSIWYLDEGKIEYAGNVPEKVLHGLLGNEEEISKLSNFLSLPEQISFNNFSYQCLLPPTVLMTGLGDPQVQQVHDALSTTVTSSKVKVLDFGMGQGRMLATIAEIEKQNSRSCSEWLDYYGFDVDLKYKIFCEKMFQEIYADGKIRYYNRETDALTAHDEESIDIIVMSNVFHEIDPVHWIKMFTDTNSLFKLLRPDGKLLIIEDQVLPIGEQAHAKGFLVFDELQFKKLFQIKEADGYQVKTHSKNARLKAHYIPKKCLNGITAESRKKAIESLRSHAIDEIKRIRQMSPQTFQTGRQHAFWTQQMANASLSLEEL